jgi:hypothetical protein
LKWVLSEHRPPDDVPQIVIRVSPQIDRQPGLTGDLQELTLDQFTVRQVPRGNSRCPEIAQSVANGNGSIQVWFQVDSCMGEEVDSWLWAWQGHAQSVRGLIAMLVRAEMRRSERNKARRGRGR